MQPAELLLLHTGSNGSKTGHMEVISPDFMEKLPKERAITSRHKAKLIEVKITKGLMALGFNALTQMKHGNSEYRCAALIGIDGFNKHGVITEH